MPYGRPGGHDRQAHQVGVLAGAEQGAIAIVGLSQVVTLDQLRWIQAVRGLAARLSPWNSLEQLRGLPGSNRGFLGLLVRSSGHSGWMSFQPVACFIPQDRLFLCPSRASVLAVCSSLDKLGGSVLPPLGASSSSKGGLNVGATSLPNSARHACSFKEGLEED